MGFDNPGHANDYWLPGSETAAAQDIVSTKNCGPLGRWFFRVDGDEVEVGGPQGTVYIDVFTHNA